VIALERSGPTVNSAMDAGMRQFWRKMNAIMRDIEREGKDALRGYIATKLTQRAAYVITSKDYDEYTTLYFHSRWMRAPARSPTGRLQAVDVLAAHAHEGGLVVRPVDAGRLLVFSRLMTRRWVKRQLTQFGLARTFGGGLRLQFARSTVTPGNIVALFRSGKQRGEILASFVQSIRIPQRLDKAKMRQILLQTIVAVRARRSAQ
jgi:hypothetical protein